jgi:hypothetical protein
MHDYAVIMMAASRMVCQIILKVSVRSSEQQKNGDQKAHDARSPFSVHPSPPQKETKQGRGQESDPRKNFLLILVLGKLLMSLIKSSSEVRIS